MSELLDINLSAFHDGCTLSNLNRFFEPVNSQQNKQNLT